jgi:transcriptional regulator with XRE-family HTH domain
MPTIGKNLKVARKHAKMSQSELARRVGVAQPQVWDWENDRYDTIDTRNVIRLARALDTTVDKLVAGTKQDLPRDLLRHKAEVEHGPTLRGADADRRIRELERQLEERETELGEMQNVAEKAIAALIDAGLEHVADAIDPPAQRIAGKARRAGKSPSGRGIGPRKAH